MKTKCSILIFALAIGFSSAANAQDAKPRKDKQSVKAPKKAPAPTEPDVTYLDLSGPVESDDGLPTITRKGSL